MLQNLLYNNLGASAFLTGSGANLLAAALIAGAVGSSVFFTDWLMAMLPISVIMMGVGYVLALRVFFPLAANERTPQVAGGIDRLDMEDPDAKWAGARPSIAAEITDEHGHR